MLSKSQIVRDFIGGADADRTRDLLNAIQALSQLSYSPTTRRDPPAKRIEWAESIAVAEIRAMPYGFELCRNSITLPSGSRIQS